MPTPGLPRQAKLAPQRRSIFPEESEKSSRLFTDPMTIDLDSIELLFGGRETAHLRADYNHFISSVSQRAGFLPNPPIQRHWKVLNDDQNRGPFHSEHKVAVI